MPVIGYNFTSMEAHSKERQKGANIKINSSPTITSVTKRDVEIAGVGDTLSIAFTFKTTYEPDVGGVTLGGEVLYKTDNAKKILEAWKKSKTLDEKIAVDVMNLIFRKCLTRIALICDDLRLPPPLAMPVVKTKGSV